MPPTPLHTFFASYAPHFTYDPSQPASAEFARLATLKNWAPKNKPYRAAKRRFRDALVEQFHASFGRDENSLTGWQALCEVIGLERVPETVGEARKLVRRTHVNLVDLTEARLLGTKARVFKSPAALREYTLEEDKIFPLHRAKASGLLKHLLRSIGA